jgi:hypothetical protein
MVAEKKGGRVGAANVVESLCHRGLTDIEICVELGCEPSDLVNLQIRMKQLVEEMREYGNQGPE